MMNPMYMALAWAFFAMFYIVVMGVLFKMALDSTPQSVLDFVRYWGKHND